MNRCLRPLSCFLTVAVLALMPNDAGARASHKREHAKKSNVAKKEARHERSAANGKGRHAKHADAKRKSKKTEEATSEKPSAPALTGDLAAVKDAIDLARKAKTDDATAARNRITDPAGQKLAEWFILRHPDTTANFNRYATFIAANPDWPSAASVLRKRAEARLWQERSDAATVHSFTGDRPISARGEFALARVWLAEGNREAAAQLARETWQSDELTERLEAEAYETFRDLLTREDHRIRMDKRLGVKDLAGAKRAAQRLGDDELAIVKACAATQGKSDKAQDQLDAVPTEARRDLGYTLCRVQWMLSQNRIDDAARLVLAAAPETMAQQDTDQWWRERRSLARKLLDAGKFQDAYQVVRTAAVPDSPSYRADFHFMCGWIALRYLNDPATARAHFARIDEGSVNPHALSRANYWRGRLAEATGDKAGAQASYEAAARYSTAYYGQLARAKLGLDRIELRAPSPAATAGSAATDERVRAAQMLYDVGEREVVVYFVADFAEQTSDVAVLEALGEVTGRNNHARAMLELGRLALARGLAVDHYAFPTIGIPPHTQFGQDIEHGMIYSVARTESSFDQRDKSAANAVGLMQVTPEAGRDTAKRFGVSYDWSRMVSDPVYNTQMGAAELSALLSDYKGSHIMTFAGYNAGRGRVRDWVKAYGDPRDPNVDAVDWVERIPFSETRNYVQRVMENLAVYRVRFENSAPVVAKTDQRMVTHEVNAAPASVAATPAQ